MGERLTEPQRLLLAEIREKGILYITRYGRYHRTIRALARRGLVWKKEPDYSSHGMDGWAATDKENP